MRLYPRVATPDQPNYFATGALSCTLRPRGCQLTLVHAPCHSPCTCCPQRRFPIGCNPPWAMLGRCSTLVDQCSMQFHCSLSGASAPRGPTYSTVQEQQTGFSTWFDDQHAFYVCMGDSLQKKSCRILLEHLKLNGHPIRSGFPPLKFRDHNGKKKFNSGILVCTIDTDSGPARFTRSESVSIVQTSIRQGCHYSFQNAQESCRRIFLYWLGALIRSLI